MPNKGLYTVILEFRGGTYIAQVTASSPREALRTWVVVHTTADLSEWKLTREKLAELISEDDPLALSDVKNVWCISGTIDNHYALVNVIRTAQSN